jgi:hypothetical protein
VHQVETPWTGLTAKYSPRFRYEKASMLPNPQQDIKAHDFFKLYALLTSTAPFGLARYSFASSSKTT